MFFYIFILYFVLVLYTSCTRFSYFYFYSVYCFADVHLSGICYSLFTLPLVVNTHLLHVFLFFLLVTRPHLIMRVYLSIGVASVMDFSSRVYRIVYSN